MGEWKTPYLNADKKGLKKAVGEILTVKAGIEEHLDDKKSLTFYLKYEYGGRIKPAILPLYGNDVENFPWDPDKLQGVPVTVYIDNSEDVKIGRKKGDRYEQDSISVRGTVRGFTITDGKE